MKATEEDLDAWLEKVNEVSTLVNKIVEGKSPDEELTKREKEILAKIDRERKKEAEIQEEKRKIEEEEQRKIREGRPGAGEKENYASFCTPCKLEFVNPTERCFKCQRLTMTCQERRRILLDRVDDMKKRQLLKQERKKKWEMWQKTKAMTWKKTSTHYTKWEYFTDSEDEDENALKNAEPVLPKDDPNFKAMEKDIQERADRRKKDRIEAEKIKKQGNEQFAKNNYKEALALYSKALETCRDFKVCFTNRALCHLKLGNWESAAEDCKHVIEYGEYLDQSFKKTPDVNFKAFLRRGKALLELGRTQEAKEDLAQAFFLFPDHPEAVQLKREIETREPVILAQKEKERKEEETEKTKTKARLSKVDENAQKVIEEFVKGSMELEKLVELLDKDDNQVYFVLEGGPERIKRILSEEEWPGLAEDKRRRFLFFLHGVYPGHPILLETLATSQTIETVVKRLSNIIKEKPDSTKEGASANGNGEKTPKEAVAKLETKEILECEELLDLLVMSTENLQVRRLLRQKSDLIFHWGSFFYEGGSSMREALRSIFMLVSNLLTNLTQTEGGENPIRDGILANSGDFLYQMAASVKNKEKSRILMRKSVNSLLASLFLHAGARDFFLGTVSESHTVTRLLLEAAAKEPGVVKPFLGSENKGLGFTAQSALEAALAVFINLSYSISSPRRSVLLSLTSNGEVGSHLAEILEKSNLKTDSVMINRILDVMYKGVDWEKEASAGVKSIRRVIECCSIEEYSDATVKVLVVFSSSYRVQLGAKLIEEAQRNKAFHETNRKRLNGDLSISTALYCNLCHLTSCLMEIDPKLTKDYKEVIPKLIETLKDTTGPVRKNVAILIAKLSRDPECLERIRELHGTEILMNLSHFLQNP